ncbi:MAG: cytochrome c oxidase assembly protein [Gammaproteobacteria bacterium]
MNLITLFFPLHIIWPWWMALLTLAMLLWYRRGVQCLGSHVKPVPRFRQFWTYAGILIGFLAVIPPIDSVADVLYVDHMFQHFLLEMIAPFCLALGAPLAPLIAGMPEWIRHRIFVPVVRNRGMQGLYRFLIHPVTAALFFAGVCGFWLLPHPFDATVRSGAIDDLCHLTLLTVGLFFWWMVLDPRNRSPRAYLLHFLILMILMNFFIIVAAYITMTGQDLYPVYNLTSPAWGLSEVMDQQLGGLLLWIPGSLVHVLGALIIFRRWIRNDEAHHARSPVLGIDSVLQVNDR